MTLMTDDLLSAMKLARSYYPGTNYKKSQPGYMMMYDVCFMYFMHMPCLLLSILLFYIL